MITLDLSPDMQQRLEALARRTGRSPAEFARSALVEHIQDLEDLAVAEARLGQLRAGASERVSLEDLLSHNGLAD